jgi:hypothetical protein
MNFTNPSSRRQASESVSGLWGGRLQPLGCVPLLRPAHTRVRTHTHLHTGFPHTHAPTTVQHWARTTTHSSRNTNTPHHTTDTTTTTTTHSQRLHAHTHNITHRTPATRNRSTMANSMPAMNTTQDSDDLVGTRSESYTSATEGNTHDAPSEVAITMGGAKRKKVSIV